MKDRKSRWRTTILTFDGSTVGDYTLFQTSWSHPAGGIHGYLARFLNSGDPTFQHIAIWTLLQLLESNDRNLIQTIFASKDVMEVVREISRREVESDSEGNAGGNAGGADVEESEDGEAEVVALARRCLELGDAGSDASSRGDGQSGDRRT